MSHLARVVAFWAVVLASLGFTGYVAVHGARPRAEASVPVVMPTPSPTKPPTVGLFIGDSYTAGSTGVGQGSTFAARACATLGWICYYDAEPGAGYVSRGYGTEKASYPDRLDGDAIYLPDVVVVSGGRADLGSGGVQAAATRYLADLAEQFDSAKIYVLEPFWPSTTPPMEVRALQRQVREAARAADVTWIPTSGWLQEALMADDGVLPDAGGHEAMAAKLVTALTHERAA